MSNSRRRRSQKEVIRWRFSPVQRTHLKINFTTVWKFKLRSFNAFGVRGFHCSCFCTAS